jgi:acetyl-CoA acetyltransferase
MAGVKVDDIQFAEVHDCFTIAEIVAMEDLGFVARGRGGFFTAEGGTRRDGPMPINASGGLKSKGHPVGATGTAQACEIYLQLTNQADRRQVAGAEVGLTENVGGSASTGVVQIYRRGD